MINVIGQCVEAGNEHGARQLFDVLETLLILVRAPSTTTIALVADFLYDRKYPFLVNIFHNSQSSSLLAEVIGTLTANSVPCR